MAQDLSRSQSFLDDIFHNLTENEHILLWGSAAAPPGFPVSREMFFSKTMRSSKPKACFFSTASAVPDTSGKLYNRQALFSRMFVLVLDDIGTGPGSKCSVDDLPDKMANEYSYRIESSPDNYQYGFILDEPISDLPAAKEFVKLMYASGPWDSGGAMPNKLVRMPCGNNMKEKHKPSKSEFWGLSDAEYPDDGEKLRVWSPDELLVAVSAGVTWAEVVDGTASQRDPRRTRGTTAWRPGVYHATLAGVVDEALEWLNAQGMVVNERGDWIDVICPNADKHTDGGNTAGVCPLGVGDRPETRGFHCFHSHCAHITTADFLAFIAASGGPNVPVFDPIPGLVARWALDSMTNEFIDMQSPGVVRVPNAGFKNAHQRDVFWTGMDGKMKKATQYGLITKSEGLLTLFGSECRPGGERILERNGAKRLNSWNIPNWQGGDAAKAGPFIEFIKYLMPDDHEFFFDHVASKAQTPTYRGPGLIMSTPAQGTGRGTLGKMLGTLWGPHNIGTLGLSEMLSGLSGEGFNDFLTTMWMIVPEARESDMSRRQEARAYETLKSGVDPEATEHVIKRKYGGQSTETCYSSAIICSNHSDVLNVPVNDRRFRFIECTVKPESAGYFHTLNAWLAGSWAEDVWAWLIARDVSSHDGFARANEVNEGSRDSVAAKLLGQSSIDRLVSVSCLYADEHLGGVIATRVLCDAIAGQAMVLGVGDVRHWEDIYKRGLQSATAEIRSEGARRCVKIAGVKFYLRHTLTETGYGNSARVKSSAYFNQLRERVEGQDPKDFVAYCQAIFNEAGV